MKGGIKMEEDKRKVGEDSAELNICIDFTTVLTQNRSIIASYKAGKIKETKSSSML